MLEVDKKNKKNKDISLDKKSADAVKELEAARILVMEADQAEAEFAIERAKLEREEAKKKLAKRRQNLLDQRAIQKKRKIAAKALIKKAIEMEKLALRGHITDELLAWLKLHK